MGQGLACPLHATAMLIKLFLSRKAAKAGEKQQPLLGLKPHPGMCLERRTHFLGPGTSSDCGTEQYGEHVAEDHGTVEVFSLHNHPGEQAQQEAKRTPNATKY